MTKHVGIPKKFLTGLLLSGLFLMGSTQINAETTETSTSNTTEEVVVKEDKVKATEAIFSLNDKDKKQSVKDKLFMLVVEDKDKKIQPLTFNEEEHTDELIAFKMTKAEKIVIPDELLDEAVVEQLSQDFKLIELAIPEDKLKETDTDNTFVVPKTETKQITKQFDRSEKAIDKNLAENYDAISATAVYDDAKESVGTAYAMKMSLPVAEEVVGAKGEEKKAKVFAKQEMAEADQTQTSSSNSDPEQTPESKYSLNIESKDVTLAKGSEQPSQDELKQWFNKVEVVEGDTVKGDLTDYTVTLINPVTVDTEKVGTFVYDVQVKGTFEGNEVVGEAKVSVEIDGEGKGDGGTPPQTTDTSSSSSEERDKERDSQKNSGKKKSETLPQTGELMSKFVLPLGMILVGTPVILMKMKK